MRGSQPNGNQPASVTDRGIVLRDPLPSARAILWKPLPDSYHLLASMMRTTAQQAALFITQRAFLQVERHLRSAPDLELGGFLAGQLFECPRARVRYSVINTVVPFADVSSDALISRVTQESYDTVRKRLEKHQLSLIGWYRNGTGLGLQLLPDDVETHLTYFDQPWQTTMLVIPDAAKPKGAFFTYDSRVGRSYCIPFYELFDSPGLDSKRLDRTCVSWTTYVAAQPVAPLPVTEKEIVEATVTPPRKPTPEPEPKEPIDEWWEAIKDPWVRLKDVAAPKARPDDVASPVADSARETVPVRHLKVEPLKVEPRSAPSPAREPRVPEELAPTPPVINAVPRPTRSQSAAAQPAMEPAPVQPPFQRPTPVQRDRPKPGMARPGTPLGSPRKQPSPALTIPAAAASGPAVALPPDFHEEARRWQRRRRIGFAVATMSFLSVIALSTLRSRTSGGAPPTAPVAAPSVSSAGVTVAMNGSTAPVELSLGAAVDSLSGALAYYRDIATDHRDGLVGCRVLDRAYALVGRARTRVDSARQQIAGSLADADSIRVSMLGAEYTFVTQTYRRSGCRS